MWMSVTECGYCQWKIVCWGGWCEESWEVALKENKDSEESRVSCNKEVIDHFLSIGVGGNGTGSIHICYCGIGENGGGRQAPVASCWPVTFIGLLLSSVKTTAKYNIKKNHPSFISCGYHWRVYSCNARVVLLVLAILLRLGMYFRGRHVKLVKSSYVQGRLYSGYISLKWN